MLHRLAATFALGVMIASCAAGDSRERERDGSGGSGAGGGIGGSLNGPGGGGSAPDCADGAELVYVVDDVDTLYSFDPPTLSFHEIGTLTCGGQPFSMAVDRQAQAWLLTDDGNLWRVDTSNAACSPTSYVPSPTYRVFGMGFAADGPVDRLYVHDNSPYYATDDVTFDGLGVLDTATLALSVIGPYGELEPQRLELTGTSDGHLHAFLPDLVPPVIVELDKSTASILSIAEQPGVDGQMGGFAFAHWGGDFWMFYSMGPVTPSFVARYRPSDASTTIVKSDVPFIVVGAGVSTCAPIAPPL
jgi:hypothetical protein